MEEALDLRGIPCPKNTSLAMIQLATMDIAEILTILLDEGEPLENVPASLELEGHVIKSKTKMPEGHWVIIVEVAA